VNLNPNSVVIEQRTTIEGLVNGIKNMSFDLVRNLK